jgi:hypothetical protein
MKTADLNRFLVGCALVSDLYCPGYNPRQPLEKNSNLARTALRYKVNGARVSAELRNELLKPKGGAKAKLARAKSVKHKAVK